MGGEAKGHAVCAVLVLVRGWARWCTSTSHEPSDPSPSAPSGPSARRSTASSGVGSYTRAGFSPVLSEERWILQADDTADVAHNGIYQNVVSCGSSFPMRVTLLGPLCGQRGGHSPPRRLVSHRRGVGGRHVVVEVRQQRVRLPRADGRFARRSRTIGASWPAPGCSGPPWEGKGSDVVTTYAVCPLCHYRQDFAGKPGSLKCVRCGASSPVDWSETC